MKETNKQNVLSRRSFISGAGTLTLAGAMGALTGCSPKQEATTGGDTSGAPTQAVIGPANISETLSCDIAIVGAGGSGLAAAVQASELGASVICVESQSVAGGNLNGVEGCFGIGSAMQKAKGIEVDPGKTICSELAASQFRAGGPNYVDMVHASGENIDWLVEQGVQFEGVDADKGDILVFHRFANRGMNDYVAPMREKAEQHGVSILFETKGEQLIVGEDGSVGGLYAITVDDTYLQINAKAVIVATGGYVDNEEYMADLGIRADQMRKGGMLGHDGSGHKMAIEAEAASNRTSTSLLAAFYVEGTPGYYEDGKYAFVIGVAAPYSIWVNERAERFVNEDFTAANIMLMSLPFRMNKDTYIVMDQAMMDIYQNGDAAAAKQTEDGIAAGSIFKGDSVEALAAAIGVDAIALSATVERYNGFVADGSDKDFGKNADVLMPLTTGPFYAIKPILEVNTSIGSIKTDRSFHAVDEGSNPIEGLYVVGVEGAMLWANVYTINVSGGCNANNINSGRTAAKDAVAKYL
jgi:fumarate reductase flavoprotein subunit